MYTHHDKRAIAHLDLKIICCFLFVSLSKEEERTPFSASSSRRLRVGAFPSLRAAMRMEEGDFTSPIEINPSKESFPSFSPSTFLFLLGFLLGSLSSEREEVFQREKRKRQREKDVESSLCHWTGVYRQQKQETPSFSFSSLLFSKHTNTSVYTCMDEEKCRVMYFLLLLLSVSVLPGLPPRRTP